MIVVGGRKTGYYTRMVTTISNTDEKINTSLRSHDLSSRSTSLLWRSIRPESRVLPAVRINAGFAPLEHMPARPALSDRISRWPGRVLPVVRINGKTASCLSACGLPLGINLASRSARGAAAPPINTSLRSHDLSSRSTSLLWRSMRPESRVLPVVRINMETSI